jgi:hypothetical protein
VYIWYENARRRRFRYLIPWAVLKSFVSPKPEFLGCALVWCTVAYFDRHSKHWALDLKFIFILWVPMSFKWFIYNLFKRLYTHGSIYRKLHIKYSLLKSISKKQQ